MPLAEVNGVRLYHELHGCGAPLLLIAGLASDTRSWGGVTEALSRRFRCIVFDNRGAGRSGAPPPPYTARQMAGDAAALLDLLKIPSAHVLGHSMGGYIAQEFALAFPERVERLVLAGTAPVSSARNVMLFESFCSALEGGADIAEWVRNFLYWGISHARFDNGEFIEDLVRKGVKNSPSPPPAGFRGQVDAIASFDARGRLKDIQAAALVIHGNRDILILPEEAEALLRGIPGADGPLVMEGAGHSLQIECPDAFARAAGRFLAGG